MKKRAFYLIMLCILVYSCTSHSTDNIAISDTLSTSADSAIAISNTEASLNKKTYDEIGFELLKTERLGGIKIGLSALKTVELIGEPEEKSTAENWEADGETHQIWTYKKQGVSIDMGGKGIVNQVINNIKITAPCDLKTTKQIGIGSTKQAVQKAYDQSINKTNSESDVIVAGTIYGGIIFNFEDGKVKNIFFGSSAE